MPISPSVSAVIPNIFAQIKVTSKAINNLKNAAKIELSPEFPCTMLSWIKLWDIRVNMAIRVICSMEKGITERAATVP